MKVGLLFDLDGTLLDTLEDLLDATNYALNACGYPARTLSQLRAVVGNGAANQIRKSLPEGTPEAVVEQVLGIYKPYYTANCQKKTAPYPGISQALQTLKETYPMAIVSNKPDKAVKELCSQWFPGIYALGETADCPRKPAPDMLLHLMSKYGLDPAQCVMIGDRPLDTEAGMHAGVLSVLLDPEGRFPEGKCDLRIPEAAWLSRLIP